jgi:hypothetical protein
MGFSCGVTSEYEQNRLSLLEFVALKSRDQAFCGHLLRFHNIPYANWLCEN